MNLTDVEKGQLLSAVQEAIDSTPFNSDDPYCHLMRLELLDICKAEVEALVPDNEKYVTKK